MDYAITNYSSSALSDGTFRVAKLNNSTKRPVLVANYEKALASLKTVNSAPRMEEVSKTVDNNVSHNYDSVIEKLLMTTEIFDDKSNVTSFRKLKVNSLVKDKISNVRNYVNSKIVVEKKETIDVMPQVEVPKEEPVRENVVNDIRIAPDMVSSMNDFMGVSDTRASRYEKKDEYRNDIVNTPDRFRENRAVDNNVNYAHYEEPVNDKVNNFPSRSERNMSYEERNPYAESVNSLVNEESGAYQGKIVVGEGSKNLDKINDRINEKNNLNVHNTVQDLQTAYDNFSVSEKKKKDSIDEVLRLEKEVKTAKEKLKRQLAERAEKIADLNSKTEANQAEIADYTLHSSELRRQLDELLSQINENSSDY